MGNIKTLKTICLNIFILFFVTGCDFSISQKKPTAGTYLLLDTSGTYADELAKAQQIILYLLAKMEAGDVLAVAKIDSASFSEKDIVASIRLDARPSVANAQKREFANTVTSFIDTVESSEFTDISGGLLQATEYLDGSDVSKKTLILFSDLKEELPEGHVRDFTLSLNGYAVKAVNVTKLRSDSINPSEYLERVAQWRQRVETAGGNWQLINQLDELSSLTAP